MGFSTFLPKFTFEKDIKNARNDDTSIASDGNKYYPHAFFGRIFVKVSWVDRYKFWSMIELISLKIKILIKLMTCLSVLFVTTITFWKYFFSISDMCMWQLSRLFEKTTGFTMLQLLLFEKMLLEFCVVWLKLKSQLGWKILI